MIRGDTQHVIRKLRRRSGWAPQVALLACLALGACVASWSALEKCQPALPAATSPGIAIGNSDELEFIPASGSQVELQGTSTIGPWKSSSSDIHGQVILYTDETQLEELFDRIEAAAANAQGSTNPPPISLPVRAPPVADISVPVMSLRGDSIGMEHDMQKALNAAEHPVIEYALHNVQQAAVQQGSRDHAAELKLSVAGTLHMAGSERPVTMDVIVRRESRGQFLAQARATMLMSDFGVAPPVALFGLIKGGNQVQVVFDLDLVLKHGPPATQANDVRQ
jgi:hypothetical protein